MRARKLTRSGKWMSYTIPCHVPIRHWSQLQTSLDFQRCMREWCSANLTDPFVIKRHTDNSIMCLVTNSLDLMRVMSEFPNE